MKYDTRSTSDIVKFLERKGKEARERERDEKRTNNENRRPASDDEYLRKGVEARADNRPIGQSANRGRFSLSNIHSS